MISAGALRGSVPQRLSLQEKVYLPKRRPLGLMSSPTFAHQVHDVLRGRRGGWSWEVQEVILVPVELPEVIDHLGVRQGVVRSSPRQVEDLPQCDPEGPDVTLGRVLAL